MGWNENKTYANYIKKRREEFNEAVERQGNKWRDLERERDEARAELANATDSRVKWADVCDRYRKAIEDAPHAVTCTWDDDERRQLGRKQCCDCWKRDALQNSE